LCVANIYPAALYAWRRIIMQSAVFAVNKKLLLG
jgi:hypothetical protein